MTSLTKNPKPKTKKFFSLQIRRLAESFERLNSSLVQLASDFCPHKTVRDPAVFARIA